MGGSLAAALAGRRACKRLIGVARRRETLDLARQRGWIDDATADLQQGVRAADLVILATPPRVILRQIDAAGAMLRPGSVLMDLASTKAEIVDAMRRLPAGVHPIGAHPMCGKEQTGLEAADPDLYRGQLFILSPLDRTPPEALELGRSLATAVGAHPLLLDAETHDRGVAWMSHLPHVVALALMRAAITSVGDDSTLWSLAAGGFRDTTRLAASSRDMMIDIFLTNRHQILDATRRFQASVSLLHDALAGGDEKALIEYLDDAIERRRQL